MAFACDQPGCTYHAANRTALVAHKRTRHPGAAHSARRTRYNLGKARERLGNGLSFGRGIFSGHSRLWRLPKNVLSVIASSLTGKNGSFKQQVRAAKNSVTRLATSLTGRGGGRRTRRGSRK